MLYQEEVKDLLNEHSEVEELQQSENVEDAISCSRETVEESAEFPKEDDFAKGIAEPMHMADQENSDSERYV